MSLLQGSFNWAVFETFGESPKDADLFELLTKYFFKDGHPTDSHSIGFCNWNDIAGVPTQESTFLADGWVLFGIRKDSKRVPKTIINMEFREYYCGLTPEQKKGLNKKAVISDITDKLLPSIPFIPTMQCVAWHRPTHRIYCEGYAVYDWLVGHLGKLGICFQPASFLDSNGKAFEMIRNMELTDIHCNLAPSLVPDLISFIPTSDLTLQLEDQKISFLGGEEDADASKAECQSLLEKGGKIVKMKVLTNLEDDNYLLMLNSTTPNNLKFNPGNIRGVSYDKLFYRLERVLALTYTLEKVLKVEPGK